MPIHAERVIKATGLALYEDPALYSKRRHTPGCYILKQTGTLLRVPPDALIPGRSPAIDVVSNQQWFVAKISSDPYMTLSKARAVAADLDLPVNF